MKIQLVTVMALAFAASSGFAADVARVYVSRVWSPSDQGVVTYLVDESGNWTFERRFIPASTSCLSARPAACIKVGDFFYVLDQHKDPATYFSILKYDEHGAFRSMLVDKYSTTTCKDEDNKRDNVQTMAVSPDGKYFYLATWQTYKLLRVSVASGKVEEFDAPDIWEGQSIDVGADGTIYVASRSKGKVNAFNPADLDNPGATLTSIRSYGQSWASGLTYDTVDDRVCIGSHQNANGGFSIYKSDGTLVSSFSDPTLRRPLAMARIGNKLYCGCWDGYVVELDPSTRQSRKVIENGLGNLNHFCVERLPVTPKIASPASHSSAVNFKDGLYFAADNAEPAAGGEAVSTFWKSTDGGVTWTTFATCDAANPSLFVDEGELSVLLEPRRAAGAVQKFEVGLFAADGTYSRSFDVESKFPEALVPANGCVKNARWGFAGYRLGIGMKTPTARTTAFLTFLSRSRPARDAVITQNVVTNGLIGVRSPIADLLPAALTDGPAVDNDESYRELVPVVQRHNASATRVGPEYALVTRHHQPGTENFSPKYAPVTVDNVLLPGASKAFDFFYDAASELYWAVTMPVTNVAMIAEREQSEVRNVIALFASADMHQWRLCSVIRAEGTPESVAFANPVATIAGNDLVVTYSTAGTDNTGFVTIGGAFVCQRVKNFRNTWPGEVKPDERIFAVDFNLHQLKSCSRDPVTGAWRHETLVSKGSCGGRQFLYPTGVAVYRTSVFVTCEGTGVFEFSTRGRFRRVYDLPANTKCDALAVSPDGSYLLVTDSSWINGKNSHNTVRKLTLADGVWTTLAPQGGTTVPNPRGICVKSDGSFFVASRDSNFVRHYAPDGSSFATISTTVGALSLALDEDESHLFVGTRKGGVFKFDLSDNSSVVLTPDLADNDGGAMSLACKDGCVWCSDFHAGIVFCLDPNSQFQEPQPTLSGFAATGRLAFGDLSVKDGLLILMK